VRHCTILFKECEKGHDWLTTTNWIQHGCPTCAAAEARAKALEEALAVIQCVIDKITARIPFVDYDSEEEAGANAAFNAVVNLKSGAR
jgi:hypothetical protein